MKEDYHLVSGKSCKLVRVRNELIPNYYVLVYPRSQGEPHAEEVSEMITLGINKARQLASNRNNDPEAFTLLYSGYSARREKGWHIHIVLLGNRWHKAWLYVVLAGKNVLQALHLRKDDRPRL